MENSTLIAIARLDAANYSLDPALVCAVCEQESGDRNPDPITKQEKWNPWAIRYEPAFYAKYIANLPLTETEGRARAFSWGVMQTMLQSVREIGYKGDAAMLCEPTTGIQWGCQLLAKKIAAAHGDTAKGLQFWNGGGNPNYAAEVMARMPNY